jgi:hypothetical protein
MMRLERYQMPLFIDRLAGLSLDHQGVKRITQGAAVHNRGTAPLLSTNHFQGEPSCPRKVPNNWISFSPKR